jgi:hypothetical protein
MKTRLALVSLLVFFVGSLVWLSVPSTKASAQTASPEAVCVEGCNDRYVICHDAAVDALTACLDTATTSAAKVACTEAYEARQATCKRAHDACIDGC